MSDAVYMSETQSWQASNNLPTNILIKNKYGTTLVKKTSETKQISASKEAPIVIVSAANTPPTENDDLRKIPKRQYDFKSNVELF